MVFAWVRSQSFPVLVNSDQPKQTEGNKASATSEQIGNNLDMKDNLETDSITLCRNADKNAEDCLPVGKPSRSIMLTDFQKLKRNSNSKGFAVGDPLGTLINNRF